MDIKEFVRSNKVLYFFVKQQRNINYYLIPNLKFNIKRFLRKNGINRDEYLKKIKDYKNKHYGDRCFIIATGPSLKISDLEMLKNEVTIGMNSISKIGDKTSWRPTYYGVQDEAVYKNLKKDIEELKKHSIIFISDILGNKENVAGENVVYMPIHGKDHLINPNANNIEFSSDCYDVIFDGYTITYSLLQLAVYMGFKEIYLLGADCGYAKKGPQHFIETGVIDPNAHIAGKRMIRVYEVAKEFAQNNGVKIYNATRGGYLEIFERVSMDEIKFK